MRNWSSIEAFKAAVYPSPDYIDALATSTPISEHVRVDFELWGCPIDKGQLLSVITDLLGGVPEPVVPGVGVGVLGRRGRRDADPDVAATLGPLHLGDRHVEVS